MFSDLKKIDEKDKTKAKKSTSFSPTQKINIKTLKQPATNLISANEKSGLEEELNTSGNTKIDTGMEEMRGVVTDVVTSLTQDVSLRVWKDIIENTETHNSSLRITNDEIYEVEDLINDLKRNLKVKTSLNEVARLGLLYIIRDFKKKRENSLVYKVKKS